MRSILDHIGRQSLRHARLPLFDFLGDASLAPRNRLAFLPALGPYVIVHGDLMRHVLREAGPHADALQLPVREHTLRAEHDWAHYADDLVRFGPELPHASGAQRWHQAGDAHLAGRMLGYKLVQLAWQAVPAVRLAMLAAIERAQGHLRAHGTWLAEAHHAQGGARLQSFDAVAVRPRPTDAAWSAIELDHPTRAAALACVDEVFLAFGTWSYELLRQALAQFPRGTPSARAAAMWPIDPSASDEENLA